MKALRLLGIALLACSMMFVSCKKDNPKPDNSTSQQQGDGDGNTGGETVEETPGVYVTFGSDSWTVGEFLVDDETYASAGKMYIFLFKTTSSDNYPQFQGVMSNHVGTTTQSNNDNLLYIGSANEINEQGQVQWAATALQNVISAIDLNTHTISAVQSGSMSNSETGETRDFNIKYVSAVWTPATVAKGGLVKF